MNKTALLKAVEKWARAAHGVSVTSTMEWLGGYSFFSGAKEI